MAHGIFVSGNLETVSRIMGEIVGTRPSRQDFRLLDLALKKGSPPPAPFLRTMFDIIVSPRDGIKLLEASELAEVLNDAEGRQDLFIGGAVDVAAEQIVLYRGDLSPLVVPWTWFKARSDGPRPNWRAFEVVDHGQTVKLGDYEAAADALLYEFDGEARKRMKARERQRDASFGGALRRLRLARGLRLSDFPGVPAKTVARIERGQVAKPHARTLKAIAKWLGVKPDEIASY